MSICLTKSCIVCFISWFQAQKSSPLPDFLPNYLSPILATARMKLCQVGQHLSKWRGKWNDYVEEKSTHKMLKDSGKDAKMVLLNLIPLWKGLLSKIRLITGINFPWTASSKLLWLKFAPEFHLKFGYWKDREAEHWYLSDRFSTNSIFILPNVALMSVWSMVGVVIWPSTNCNVVRS